MRGRGDRDRLTRVRGADQTETDGGVRGDFFLQESCDIPDRLL